MTLRPVNGSFRVWIVRWRVSTATPAPAQTRRAKMSCCGPADSNCQLGMLREARRAFPVAPAPVPSTSQNELQALAASVVSLLALPLSFPDKLPAQTATSISVTAIPLFQRDCCYLI
jgi:hypothetical protein